LCVCAQNLLNKINAREDKSESRIGSLESLVKKVGALVLWATCRVCSLRAIVIMIVELERFNKSPATLPVGSYYTTVVSPRFAFLPQEVAGSLDARLTALEQQMKGNVEKKMLNIESSLDRKMNRLQNQAAELGKEQAGSWKIPFLILVVLMIAAAIGLYFFYERMRKMHLL
jgi:hypothetical protein